VSIFGKERPYSNPNLFRAILFAPFEHRGFSRLRALAHLDAEVLFIPGREFVGIFRLEEDSANSSDPSTLAPRRLSFASLKHHACTEGESYDEEGQQHLIGSILSIIGD
jgi:hypothetical protein